MRIAMWSGPRNLSTAMMYAFATQPDFAVWDEPFYGAYLAETGADHPMREEVLASYECDAVQVAQACVGQIPGDATHHYQKHMTHHMCPTFPMEWLEDVTSVFLIRHPARVVASYARKRENPNAQDLGFQNQYEIFERVAASGQAPVVIDSADIRDNPEGMLSALLSEIGFEDASERARAMTKWASGGIPEDGPWAPHWYGAVHRSTGFEGAEGPLPELDGSAAALAEQLMGYYEALAEKRLRL